MCVLARAVSTRCPTRSNIERVAHQLRAGPDEGHRVRRTLEAARDQSAALRRRSATPPASSTMPNDASSASWPPVRGNSCEAAAGGGAVGAAAGCAAAGGGVELCEPAAGGRVRVGLVARERILVLLVTRALRERGARRAQREQGSGQQQDQAAPHDRAWIAEGLHRLLRGEGQRRSERGLARGARTRLPARPARRRARLPRHVRDLAGAPTSTRAVYDEQGTEGRFAHRDVHTSFLQRLRPTARTFRALLPLYPSAIESFDLSGYDLVVSSSSAWAHAVICDETTVHVSYCHNPFRYAWNDRDRTLAAARPAHARRAARLFRRWRQWDWIAAQRVDRYLTNSRTTQAPHPRLLRPRVDGRVSAGGHQRASRPGARRRPLPGALGADAAQAHRRGGRRRSTSWACRWWWRATARTCAGCAASRDRRALRRPRERPRGGAAARQRCRALVVTAVEEFGIAAVEAQAAGRPAISVRSGGALETVARA